MKRSSTLFPLAVLAVVGCSGQVDQARTASETDATVAAPADDMETAVSFVSLKVPNME